MQKANASLSERLTAVNKFADEMLKLSHSSENRARIEKLKGRAADYVKGTQQIIGVRSEAISLGAAGASPDAAAQVARLNNEAIRIAREVTLPIAAEVETLAAEIADFAKHRAEEENAEAAREMAAAERLSLSHRRLCDCTAAGHMGVFLLHYCPSDARLDGRDGETRRRQLRRRAAGSWPQG